MLHSSFDNWRIIKKEITDIECGKCYTSKGPRTCSGASKNRRDRTRTCNNSCEALCWLIHIDELAASFPNRTGTFQCIRLSRSPLQRTSCIPSPCLRHYPEHLGIMDAPSPCIRRCLGDPLVILLLWSECRCLVRRTIIPKNDWFSGETFANPPNIDWQSWKQTAEVQAIQLSPYSA